MLQFDTERNCDINLFDAAAAEMKQLLVRHMRMQSRPSDSREQKVGRRRVSGRGSEEHLSGDSDKGG